MTPFQPDGYQIIDVTTGDTIHFKQNQILTWELAWKAFQWLDLSYAEIRAVTEARVNEDLDLPDQVEYLPEFFIFTGGLEDSSGSVFDIVDPDRPDRADLELPLNPSLTLQIIRILGLSYGPFHPMLEKDGEEWPLHVAREAMENLLKQEHQFQGPLHKAMIALEDLLNEINHLGATKLVLKYSGWDIWKLD